MESTKTLKNTDLPAFLAIVEDYLPGNDTEELLAQFDKGEGIFAAYYLDDDLIGVCFGSGAGGRDICLSGIAIIDPYDKQGRGGKLLGFFEDVARAKGFESISLGSADGYVERFYIKNGYQPQSLKILTDNDKWKEREHPQFKITDVEEQGKYTKLVLGNMDYENMDKHGLCEFYGGHDCFFVFGKEIGW